METKEEKNGEKAGEETVLDVKDLVVHYVLEGETVEAVNGVTLMLKQGQTLGLVGETGAGKTSTALSILNLIQTPPGVIKTGSIRVCGADMLTMNAKQLEKIRGKVVSMIFQDPMTALNPVKTVGRQVAESIKYHEGLSKKQSFDKAVEVLEMVGIPGERAIEYPHQFSGGMKQRVVIAIALACNPVLLLADEPTSALDVTIQAQVLEMMKDLKTRLSTSMIIITHDLGVVAKTCDDVCVMYAGEMIEYGSAEDIFESDEHHPYTVGLFGSIPNLEEDSDRLSPIDGLMPDPTNLPKGCNFSPRCPQCMDVCIENPPVMYTNGTHRISCHLFSERQEVS